jgi:glycosyltransferase involved in cell wall biosynthesis
MKLLLLTGQFYPKTSGGAFEDWNFSKQAAERGHDIYVYTSREGAEPRFESVSGVQIRRPYRGTPEESHPNSKVGQVLRILFIVRLTICLLFKINDNFDAIYSTGHMFHPTAKLVGRIRGIPVINLVAYSPSIKIGRLSKTDLRVIFERINFRYFMGELVLSRTPQIRDILRNKYNTPAKIVHGIVDEEQLDNNYEPSLDLRDELNIPADETILLFVGRFVDIKNPSAPVEMLSKLPDEYTLVMIGDGEERGKVEATIDNCDTKMGVHLLGEIPHDKTLDAIAMADALLVTSDVEAYPTVVFEALSLKTPVISTRVGIVSEITHKRITESSIENMAATIKCLDFESKAEVDRETLKKYSISRYTDETISAIKSVLHR